MSYFGALKRLNSTVVNRLGSDLKTSFGKLPNFPLGQIPNKPKYLEKLARNHEYLKSDAPEWTMGRRGKFIKVFLVMTLFSTFGVGYMCYQLVFDYVNTKKRYKEKLGR